jgi:hypothetical protein
MLMSTNELLLPTALQKEFATVVAVWASAGRTRGVDALVLSWVKYEKQLRRLFCFLVFQNQKIAEDQIDEIVTTLAENRRLYPRTFMTGIRELGVTPVEELLTPSYETLSKEIERIKKTRDKLVHGQITGQRIQTPQLEHDVRCIVEWIAKLAERADAAFRYNGLKQNTFIRAKAAAKISVAKYPFSTPSEFKEWLSDLADRCLKPKKLPAVSATN